MRRDSRSKQRGKKRVGRGVKSKATTSVECQTRGILLFGLGVTLGYRKIQKTGTAVQSLTRLPVLIEAVGRAVSNETETINRNMDTIMMKLTALEVKLGDFRDQNGQRE